MAASIPTRCARRRSKSTFPRAARCWASASNSTAKAPRWPDRMSVRSRWSSSTSTTSRMWCGRRARRNARPCCRCRRARPTATNRWSWIDGRDRRAGSRGLGQAVWRLHGRQQGIVQGRSGRDPRPDRPERLGQEHDLQHALRHAFASAGSIKFAGTEIAGLAPHRIINRGIGRTFQIPRPFHRLTMFDNVALAGYFGQGRHSRAKAEDAAERALAMVGLPADRTISVDGLGAAGLKKLELAKALATGPKLLLADESLG